DEPLASRMVKEYLSEYTNIEVVAVCQDGFEGVKAIQLHKPDLVFLDIQMPKINGFEMLELIENPPAIIFTTAFDEYAIKAFEQHAVDYLLKPFSQERFDKAVRRFISQASNTSVASGSSPDPSNRKNESTNNSGTANNHAANNKDATNSSDQPLTNPYHSQKEKTRALLDTAAQSPEQADRIVIRDNSHIRIIPVPDIIYIEAADDYARIVTANGAYLKNKTMSSFEKQLPPQTFVRIHRSTIVNVTHITQLHPHDKENYMALLKNGIKLTVSKTGYAKLRDILGMR
ncbi:MAG TPA: LytTR family DNA-binding domain-containing protein, partial [Flavihumibacter sp.]|nr:LytTR family DNA-binding domain-containing protein [Flavihumibacter sp.]